MPAATDSNQSSFHTVGKSITAYNQQTNSAIFKRAPAWISVAVIWIILACNTLIVKDKDRVRDTEAREAEKDSESGLKALSLRDRLGMICWDNYNCDFTK